MTNEAWYDEPTVWVSDWYDGGYYTSPREGVGAALREALASRWKTVEREVLKKRWKNGKVIEEFCRVKRVDENWGGTETVERWEATLAGYGEVLKSVWNATSVCQVMTLEGGL